MKVTKLVVAATALSSVVALSSIIAVAPAGAADLPPGGYKAPPPPPLYLWSGLYVGAHLGGGWLSADDGLSASGFLGGGQVGYNFQTGNWVWGVEADISGASVNQNLAPGLSVGADMVSTLTARAGYAWDRWLIYGKAGVGWVDINASLNGLAVGVPIMASASGTSSGGAFGVGAEYALGSNWSAKVEYEIIDLGSDSGFSSTTFQSVKAGVNYHFGVGRY